jgi:hypothetical protein
MASASSGSETNSAGPEPGVSEYCREIETYLCRKNDGHLIRITGPSFDIVSRWAARRVPLKVAFRGVDRYFERYYRKGSRRRPVRIDFCEADVLDVFDEWRRALGLAGDAESAEEAAAEQREVTGRSRISLPEHLARALTKLTNARANGLLDAEADRVLDRVAAELERARASSNGLRGAARSAMVVALAELDAELLTVARSSVAETERVSLEREADEALAAFRPNMPLESYLRVRAAAMDKLTRDRLGLPTLTFG